MKDVALKGLFLLSVFVMVDYLIMIVIGCVSSSMGCTLDYYECTFCTIGKSLFGISSILFVGLMMGDFKALLKKPRPH